jgi:SAM-dependent methyltransferase
VPVADGACDLVWCRDTLSCLPDCGRALREFARVLRPGGGLVLYAVFATGRLEPGDRALLIDGLGNSPASMHQPTVEAAIAAAGFEVVRRERIGSEWTEHRLEHDPGDLTQELLEVARLIRDRERMEAALGPGLVPARPGLCPVASADRARPARAGPVRAAQARPRCARPAPATRRRPGLQAHILTAQDRTAAAPLGAC